MTIDEKPYQATDGDGKASQTYARLLEVAATLFRRRGYGGTTTRELAAQLGIQNASLYHYVRGKDDLLYELSVDSLSRISRAVSEAVAKESDPFAQLRAAVRVHLATALSDQDKHATMLSELRSLPTHRRQEVINLRDAYQRSLEALIAAAQEEGSVRADIPARILTLAVLNLLNWSIFWFRPDGEMSSDELADVLWLIYSDGVTQRSPAR